MIEAEVCVVGGGPAGAATSARLAGLGHDVVVVERRSLPGAQVVASLPPTILALLETLGIRDRVEAEGFPRFSEIALLWNGERPELRFRAGEKGLHVERGRFDRLMLDFAKECGARVLQPVKASRPVRSDIEGWEVPLDTDSGSDEVRAKFVVDASGGGWLPAGRRERLSPRTVALSARWSVPRLRGYAGCVEAGEQEWLWCAPLDDHTMVGAVFLDPASVKGKHDPTTTYHDRVRRSRLVGRWLGDGVAGRVFACDASIWSTHSAAEYDCLRVGDSSFRADPLSSQGVVSGVATALQAVPVIHTVLRSPQDREAALTFYNERQAERVATHCSTMAGHYRDMLERYDRAFWRERALTIPETETETDKYEPGAFPSGRSVKLSAEASIVNTPVLTDDFIKIRTALRHSRLGHPVAFVDGIHLPPLLAEINGERTPDRIVRIWAKQYSPERCRQILSWLWQNGVICVPPA